ncbi:MAG: zinc-dependent metalloprotease, partial [Chloroflexi bacterium]|nr:zinc-dependent metalloprotease [Chloroflexota bacterium]
TSITHRLGTTSSVMDYMPPLIALPGQKQGDYYTTTIGPYDYWAIAYGYSTFPGASPAQVTRDLQQIASRSSDPYLQYATDEDADAQDPTAARWDYGRDPLDSSQHDIELSHALFKRIAIRIPLHGHTYDDAFSAYTSTLGMYIGAFNTPLRFIGGSYIHRDHAGQPGARLPVQPIPEGSQVRALRLITENLFDDSALRIPASLLDKVMPDRWFHWDSQPFGPTYGPSSIRAVLLNAQQQALTILYSPDLLSRLEDQNLDPGAHGLDVAHLVDGTTWAIWSELTRPGHLQISPLRRDTQRLDLDKLVSLVVAPPPGTPEDARAMGRYELRWVRDHVHRALEAHHADLGLTAYLQDVEARADRALNAPAFSAA